MRRLFHEVRLWAALHVMPKCCVDTLEVASAVYLENVARERMDEAVNLGRKYAKAWQEDDTAVMDQLEATARDQGIFFERKENR